MDRSVCKDSSLDGSMILISEHVIGPAPLPVVRSQAAQPQWVVYLPSHLSFRFLKRQSPEAQGSVRKDFGLESSSLRKILLVSLTVVFRSFFSWPLFVFGKSLPCDEAEGRGRVVAFSTSVLSVGLG